MPNKFKELFRDLILGKEKAISSVKKNMEIIVSQYLSKKNIELDWIADKNEICNRKVLFDDLFSNLIQKIKHNRETISTFSEYKDFIISKANEKISMLFQNYFDLLYDNDKKAWPIFDELLKKRINLKLFEYQRKNKEQFSVNAIDIEQDYSDNYNQVIPDLDKEKFIPNLFKDLNEFEKKILFEVYFKEEKHKDIAKKLNITEANCRVIKHRALAKLENSASLYGYI